MSSFGGHKSQKTRSSLPSPSQQASLSSSKWAVATARLNRQHSKYIRFHFYFLVARCGCGCESASEPIWILNYFFLDQNPNIRISIPNNKFRERKGARGKGCVCPTKLALPGNSKENVRLRLRGDGAVCHQYACLSTWICHATWAAFGTSTPTYHPQFHIN